MTNNKQPEALQLAEILEGDYCPDWFYEQGVDEVSAELRRQHARIAELEAQLEAIGAGGVNGPLIGQPQAMPDLSALTERGAKAWAGVDAQELREGRWYMVNKDGMATLCADETDAEQGAKEAQTLWPHMVPHRAVHLVEAGHGSAAASAGGEPVAWKHDCAALLANDVELWIDACPHCGKPRDTAPPTAQAGGWVSVEDRLPDLMVDVLAGYWYQDTWMKGKPLVFSYGICRMYEMPDDPCFPQGKRWQTHGCAHSQITHWMPLPLPPTSAEGVEHG